MNHADEKILLTPKVNRERAHTRNDPVPPNINEPSTYEVNGAEMSVRLAGRSNTRKDEHPLKLMPVNRVPRVRAIDSHERTRRQTVRLP